MDKPARHRLIRDLIARNEVHAQEDVAALLEAEGISTTQATMSRDLRELGIVKTPHGYKLPATDAALQRRTRDLVRSVMGQTRQVDRAGNLVVIRTDPGHAEPVAVAFGRAELPGVLGAIASVDTVFVATRSATQSRELARLLGGK